jgi:hypothetical protein
MPDNNDIFDLEDFVPAGGGLPEHLKGKSAEEVAQYYSGLMRIANERQATQPPTPPARTPPAQPPAQPAPLTEADVAPALGTMIQSAKMVAKASLDEEGRKLWDRFAGEVENIMKAGFKGIQLADGQNWIFAYNQVLGAKAGQLMKESREAEVARRTAETSSAAHEAPPSEITLEPIHEELARGLNLSKDDFKNGIKIMREDKWPMTFSNVQGGR